MATAHVTFTFLFRAHQGIYIEMAEQEAVEGEGRITAKSAAPTIKAGVPFFYYHNLEEAAAWYEHKLGLKKHADEDWVVIFELNPSSHIGLVNASSGAMQPTKEKGAMLSIETDDLEGWYEKLQSTEGINMINGIEVGAQGLIDEFTVQDPGGYTVEFFRWRVDPLRFMQRK